MTLGEYLPLMAILAGAVIAFRGLRQIRSAPAINEPNYDPQRAKVLRLGGIVQICAGIATPIMLYLILNVWTDNGTLALF